MDRKMVGRQANVVYAFNFFLRVNSHLIYNIYSKCNPFFGENLRGENLVQQAQNRKKTQS